MSRDHPRTREMGYRDIGGVAEESQENTGKHNKHRAAVAPHLGVGMPMDRLIPCVLPVYRRDTYTGTTWEKACPSHIA